MYANGYRHIEQQQQKMEFRMWNSLNMRLTKRTDRYFLSRRTHVIGNAFGKLYRRKHAAHSCKLCNTALSLHPIRKRLKIAKHKLPEAQGQYWPMSGSHVRSPCTCSHPAMLNARGVHDFVAAIVAFEPVTYNCGQFRRQLFAMSALFSIM